MNAVAANAAHVVFAMSRTLEIGVFALVAAEALLVDFLGRGLSGVENLGFIAATFHVRLASAVATFAGDAALAVRFGQFAVGIGGEPLGNFFMARGANFGSDEIARRRRLGLNSRWFGTRLALGSPGSNSLSA